MSYFHRAVLVETYSILDPAQQLYAAVDFQPGTRVLKYFRTF